VILPASAKARAAVNGPDSAGAGGYRALEWDAVVPGSEGNAYLTSYPYQVLSWHPRAVLFPAFLTDEECDYVVRLAEAHLTKSALALRAGESAQGTAEIRTSDGVFLYPGNDPEGVLDKIERRIAEALLIPVEHFEGFNVLRYQLGQHYYSHMDSFDPKDFGPQPTNRLATVLLYLSDVEEGGETVLPREGKANRDYSDYQSCEHGLLVRPRKGWALAFWSLTPAGEIEPHALHGGCPVRQGTKWVATKWIRDKPIRGT